MEPFTGLVVYGYELDLINAASAFLVALTALSWTIYQEIRAKRQVKLIAAKLDQERRHNYAKVDKKRIFKSDELSSKR